MHVFITGGTGYVGRQIIRELAAEGHTIRALVRPGSVQKLPEPYTSRILYKVGDILRPESLRDAMQGCDGVIHLPGLLRESGLRGRTYREIHSTGAKNVIGEAVGSGVKRLLLMSANGVSPDAPTGYHQSKWDAEMCLKGSGLGWTIFRPSVIFGNENDGRENFITAVRRQIRMLPLVVPIPGDGSFSFQPVSIRNVAAGFVKSLTVSASIGKTYEVGGPERFSFEEIVDAVASILSIRKRKIHVPLTVLRSSARLLGRFSFFPVSPDQLDMLVAGNVTDHEKDFFADFGIVPDRMLPVIRTTLVTAQ